MSNLSNLKLGDDVDNSVEKDVLGGVYTLESAIYDMNIEVAYMGLSKKGAASLNLHLTDGTNHLRQTLYVTSNDEKGNLPYYVKDGKKFPLPSMSQANSMCQHILGQDLGDLSTEEKVIKLYDYASKAEVETKVQMLMPLIGTTIAIGVHKRTVDKDTKNDAGMYVTSGENRVDNEINKMFQSETHLTHTELKAGITEPAFAAKWEEKFKGKTLDKRSDENKRLAASGAGSSPAGAVAPTTASLF